MPPDCECGVGPTRACVVAAAAAEVVALVHRDGAARNALPHDGGRARVRLMERIGAAFLDGGKQPFGQAIGFIVAADGRIAFRVHGRCRTTRGVVSAACAVATISLTITPIVSSRAVL